MSTILSNILSTVQSNKQNSIKSYKKNFESFIEKTKELCIKELTEDNYIIDIYRIPITDTVEKYNKNELYCDSFTLKKESQYIFDSLKEIFSDPRIKLYYRDYKIYLDFSYIFDKKSL